MSTEAELMAIINSQRPGMYAHACGREEVQIPLLPGPGVSRWCPDCGVADEAWTRLPDQDPRLLSAGVRDALKSAHRIMAFDSRDWSLNPTDAWLWAIFAGWEADDGGTGPGSEDALPGVAEMHGWSDADVARLRAMRAAVKAASGEEPQ